MLNRKAARDSFGGLIARFVGSLGSLKGQLHRRLADATFLVPGGVIILLLEMRIDWGGVGGPR